MNEEQKLDNQICFRIYTAQRLLNQTYRPLLEPLGLTFPKYLVMMVLWEQDNRTVSEIGRQLALDTNTLTPLLQRMEREGLIIRTHGIADGRQTLVTLTKKGVHLEERAKGIPFSISNMLDTKQSAALIGTLDTMIENLKQRD